MLNNSILLSILTLAIAASACTTQMASEKVTTPPALPETTETASAGTEEPAAPTATPKPPAEPAGYRKQLISEQYTFDIALQGEGIMKSLQIAVKSDGKNIMQVKDSVDGEITKSLNTDLNGNGKPEVLVFLQSSGSGGYGLLYGYEIDGKEEKKLSLPPLKGELAQGYMGQDEFRVEGNRLLRTFPLYKDTDVNANPTGGKRTIEYRLTKKPDWEVAGHSEGK